MVAGDKNVVISAVCLDEPFIPMNGYDTAIFVLQGGARTFFSLQVTHHILREGPWISTMASGAVTVYQHLMYGQTLANQENKSKEN